MITVVLEPEHINAKEFYAKIEKESGKKLHKDFNVRLEFDDSGRAIIANVDSDSVTEEQVKRAAGYKEEKRTLSVSQFFRDDEKDKKQRG